MNKKYLDFIIFNWTLYCQNEYYSILVLGILSKCIALKLCNQRKFRIKD